MDIETAFKNLDIVISNSRMSRPEHIELQGNLNLLITKARESLEESVREKKVIEILQRIRNQEVVSHLEIDEVLKNE